MRLRGTTPEEADPRRREAPPLRNSEATRSKRDIQEKLFKEKQKKKQHQRKGERQEDKGREEKRREERKRRVRERSVTRLSLLISRTAGKKLGMLGTENFVKSKRGLLSLILAWTALYPMWVFQEKRFSFAKSIFCLFVCSFLFCFPFFFFFGFGKFFFFFFLS